MKTTVELPENLLQETRRYASERGKTFKDVLIEALDLLIFNGARRAQPPGQGLFGAFPNDEDLVRTQQIVDREFSRIDPEDWK